MSEIKHKSSILATIDHLRARKARPDIDRICSFMLKKFRVSSKETKGDLKRCLDSEAVFKVDYKGNASYRNAAKWRKELKCLPENDKSLLKSDLIEESRLMTTTIAELIFVNPDYLEHGVPPHRLMRAILLKENSCYTKKYLESIIQKELASGGLVKMNNGNYSLGAGDAEQDSSLELYSYHADSNPKMTSSNSSCTSSPMRIKGKPGRKKGSVLNKTMNTYSRSDVKKEAGIRVGERRKRAKKVFDPSDNNVPSKKKRGRPVGSLNKTTIKKQNVAPSTTSSKDLNMFDQKSKSDSAESSDEGDIETNDSHSIILEPIDKGSGGICSVCRNHKSNKDNTGKLIGCRDCSNKAHPSCLQGDGMLRVRPDNTWQCPHCKTCVVCIETNDAGILTVCSVCADAYHALCHTPHITERFKAWNQWECRNCQDTKNSSKNMDPTYIEKGPGSDASSKYSDRSDSRKSSLDRRRDKSSVKSGDSDDKNDIKPIPSEKDEQSSSPTSIEKADWKISRKLLHSWKRSGQKAKEINSLTKEVLDVIENKNIASPTDKIEKNNRKANSIFMDIHEINKLQKNTVFHSHPNDRGDGPVDPTIPDAQCWTNNDVYQYFSSYFPEQAHIFKEQDIDGKSLLMMRRIDLVKSFGLPLGPALKLYRHVVKLQSRKDDFSMCWL